MTAKYTGHGANTGGLQQHTIGDIYPIGIFGQETPEGLRYGVQNFATGHTHLTAQCATTHEAMAYARRVKALRDASTFIKATLNNGGHRA